MRVNTPITQNEYKVPAGKNLVSVTDTKGRITYCNPAFVEVSGFNSQELLGQSHNIVRHPDMPEEAFRDMWATIESKQPWTALVKNRRKNGDFYWVRANATPMLDGDTLTGYLSVRTLPERHEIEAADALYRQLRAEEQSGALRHGLKQGQWVSVGIWGRLQALLKPGLVVQTILMQFAMLSILGVCLWFDLPWYATALCGVAASTAIVWLNWLNLVKPLESVILRANTLAAGDLSLPEEPHVPGPVGRLQKALQQMQVNLKTVVSDVRDEMQQLHIAVVEIANGNADLSARTESQASSLQETAASMEEITGTVQQSAAAAQRGSQLSQETNDVTVRSNEAVLAVAASMQDIAQHSEKITEIIQMIESVAFQTNILALNAAVEAARAGEQGRGFAVVATEVRALAQRTTSAAKDIRELITESAQRIQSGASHTSSAQERMTLALQAVGHVNAVLSEISHASNEQTLGISQVHDAIAQMDSITQQNAAMVEQLAATAQSLASQVDSVSASMRLFRLKGGETFAQPDAVALRRQNKLH